MDTMIIPEACVDENELKLSSLNVILSKTGAHSLAYRLLMPPQLDAPLALVLTLHPLLEREVILLFPAAAEISSLEQSRATTGSNLDPPCTR